jgi:hypothetical protein
MHQSCIAFEKFSSHGKKAASVSSNNIPSKAQYAVYALKK